MIHTASLIHDDVLDESDMRRGQKTVHQLYGTRVAVLAGDFMFAQSIMVAASARGAAIFSGIESEFASMCKYGINLGLSFQIVDDILDFTHSAGATGAKGNLTALQKVPKLRESLNLNFEIVKNHGGIERADLAIQSLQCIPHSALEGMVNYNLERID